MVALKLIFVVIIYAKDPKTNKDSVNVATQQINIVWPAFFPGVGAKESAMRWFQEAG